MDEPEHDETSMRAPGEGLDPSGLVTIKLESCHSTWHFQPVRMRFRRELKGPGLSGVRTGWRPYYGLRFEDSYDRFTVFLNDHGTRRLVSWCHPPGEDGCTQCAGMSTGDLSLDNLLQLAQ